VQEELVFDDQRHAQQQNGDNNCDYRFPAHKAFSIFQRITLSSLLAENALGPKQKEGDEYREQQHFRAHGRPHIRTERFHEADHQPSQKDRRDAADPAQHYDDKRLEIEELADLWKNRKEGQKEDARDTENGRTQGKREPVDVL
jgi:hypothetical protein